MKAHKKTVRWVGIGGLFLLAFIAVGGNSPAPKAQAAPPIFWCPNKPLDRQYTDRQEPGCQPLVQEKEQEKKGEKVPERPGIKVENLQAEMSSFMQRYRQFVNCCATDLDYLDDLNELQDKADDVLRTVQSGLFSEHMKIRNWTLRQMITSVSEARDQLKMLRTRLEQIYTSKSNLDNLDYESAGRERRRIEEQEEAIRREIRATAPAESARTGTEIGDTTVPNRPGVTAGDTSLPNITGTDIGQDQSTSLRPRMGTGSADTTMPNRPGTTSGDSTLPNTYGSDIGSQENPNGSSTTPSRVGPAVGDSSLNHRP